VVAITSPSDNANFSAGSNITIRANASDTDGAIAKVEFFQGDAKLGESISNPYSLTWSNVTEGNYLLTARASDDVGATRTSAPADTNSRTLKVYVGLYGAEGKFQSYLSDHSAPAYTDASLNSIFGSDPGVYTLTYAAASSEQTLNVIYTAQTLFDADYGNVTLQAATLSGGPTNAPPTVVITSPTNNATFTAPANIGLQADASDADATISKVEFYSGTTLLGTATNSPYAFIWTGVPAGNYAVTARATDNLGDTATSTPLDHAVTKRTATAVRIINPTWNGNGFSFSFATVSGSAYAIEYKDSLNLISWQSLTNF